VLAVQAGHMFLTVDSVTRRDGKGFHPPCFGKGWNRTKLTLRGFCQSHLSVNHCDILLQDRASSGSIYIHDTHLIFLYRITYHSFKKEGPVKALLGLTF
jgi:hypothetical protein